MPQLSSQLDWSLANSLWAAVLNPVLALKILQGRQVNNLSLANGVTVFNHGLQRVPVGWYITDVDGGAVIYRSAPFNSSTLTLTSSAAVTVSLWIF